MLFDLKNNANFLQCWRERNRPATVGSAITLLIIIEAMIFTSTYFEQTSSKPWFIESIFALSVLQGIILLFFGSLNAFKLASRERTNRTIDFHRTAPTTRNNQVLGILLGSTSLEWWTSVLIFVVQLTIGLINGVSILGIIQFYLQLSLCACLFHTFCVLVGISRDPIRNKAGIIGIFVGVIFMSFVLMMSRVGFVYQLTWMPAYHQLETTLRPDKVIEGWPPHSNNNHHELNYTLFGVKLPALPLQILIQLPYIALFWSGIGRRFTNVDQPILSKSQLSTFCFYTIFLYLGSYISLHFFSTEKHLDPKDYIGGMVIMLLVFAFVGAFLVTPSQLGYLRGLRRAKKIGKPRLNWAHNYSSNVTWTIIFCILCTITMSIYFFLYSTNVGLAVHGTTILLGHVIFFLSFYEFFQLSRFHNKKALLFTTIVILWFLLPLFGMILLASIGKDNPFITFLLAPSPMFGMIDAIYHLMEHKTHNKVFGNPYATNIFLLVSIGMAVLATGLAANQRKRLRVLSETN